MAKDTSPFTFVHIENEPVKRVHACVNIVAKAASYII